MSDQPAANNDPTPAAPPAEPAPAASPSPSTDTAPPPAPAATAPPPAAAAQRDVIRGTGRRKTSIARVRIRHGEGKVTVNGKPYDQYFSLERDRRAVIAPLEVTDNLKRLDVAADVRGGGPTGQADAILLGVARAIARADASAEPTLRDRGFLTRDARMVERKKYGQAGARRRFQFSKR